MTVGQESVMVAGFAEATALLERQRGLLREALAVGVELEGIIAQGDIERLRVALNRRGELIAELKGMDREVRAAGEWLAGAAGGEREAVLRMAQEVARLREQVLEQVRGQEQAVRETKAKLAGEVGRLSTAGTAASAYRARRAVAARFMDSKG